MTNPDPGLSRRPAARGPLYAAGAVGFVLAAVIALVLWATGVFDGTDGDGGSSDASISLPAKVGSYLRYQDVSLNKQPRAKAAVADHVKSDSKTAAALSQAYGGAGAAVQTYADRQLETSFSVWVVRAPTPAPVVTYEDAKFLGLAAPPDAVQQVGSVTCQLRNLPIGAGRTPPKGSSVVVLCQRTSGSLTVQVRNVTSNSGGLNSSVDGVAAVADQVWDAVA